MLNGQLLRNALICSPRREASKNCQPQNVRFRCNLYTDATEDPRKIPCVSVKTENVKGLLQRGIRFIPFVDKRLGGR